MINNDIQRMNSATAIRNAIIDCITIVRAEEKKNFGGVWNIHIDDLVNSLMDGMGDICGALRVNVDDIGITEYEHLTGHEMQLTQGRC